MSSPAFQFYPGDWIISTRRLSPDARCVHIDLLAFGWEDDGIPDDPCVLASMCAMTPARFRRAWTEIEAKWPLAEEGKRRNPRQERQRSEYGELREKRRKAGLASAEARANK